MTLPMVTRRIAAKSDKISINSFLMVSGDLPMPTNIFHLIVIALNINIDEQKA